MSEGHPSGALPRYSLTHPTLMGKEAQEGTLDCLSLGMEAARERSDSKRG